ncbi:hypothetical protein EI94DRAFT_1814835 [Lactarius quietus]|nr:hypothetical protein EI94DRAFT_1814835 [Lactarius quietus]
MQDVTNEVGCGYMWDGEALEVFVFDEPYMIYRDWRRITKALLARGEGPKLPKSKTARALREPLLDYEGDTAVEMDVRSRAFTHSGCGRTHDGCTSEKPISWALHLLRHACISPRARPWSHLQWRNSSVPPRYFAIQPHINLVDTSDTHVSARDDEVLKFWNALKARSSITRCTHITVVHSNQLPEHVESLEAYKVQAAGSLGQRLSRVYLAA